MRHERTRLRRLRKVATHPVAVAVLGVLLAIDVVTAPGLPASDSTLVSKAVDSMLGRTRMPRPVFPSTVVALRDSDGWRADTIADVVGLIGSKRYEDEFDVAVVVYTRIVTRAGLWRHSVETATETLELRAFREQTGRLIGDAQTALLEAFQEHVIATPRYAYFAPRVEQLRNGAITQRRIIWLGVVHDIVAFPALALFVFLVGRAAFGLTPGRRAAKRRERGMCPRCAYDVRGLPGPMCPECGKLI